MPPRATDFLSRVAQRARIPEGDTGSLVREELDHNHDVLALSEKVCVELSAPENPTEAEEASHSPAGELEDSAIIERDGVPQPCGFSAG